MLALTPEGTLTSVRRVLFVCLGNICRSPAAEAVFVKLAREAGVAVEVDSAGTSAYHLGEPPDPRMVQALKRRGYGVPHRGRQVEPEDYQRFDLLIAMDRDNQKELLRRAPRESREKVVLFRSLDDEGQDPDVPDPFYGPTEGFDAVVSLVERVGKKWLERVRT